MTSREFPDRPLVGVGAVIIRGAGDGAEDDAGGQARVLLARRGRAPSLGEWSIPGGLVKVGETLEAACVREVFEETGLRVAVVEMIELLDRIIWEEDGEGDAAPRRRVQYHYVIVDYLCRLADGSQPQDARASADATEVRWAARAELEQFSLRPALLRVLNKAFAKP